MPELPEVEAARRLVERHCIGQTITHVIAADDDKVFEGQTPQHIAATLLNRQVTHAKRKGKHLWLDFNDSDKNIPSLLFHFGMTGGMVVRGKGGAHYQRYSIDDGTTSGSWPPRFCKLELHFNNGDTQLAFCDSRRFARVRLQTNPLLQPPLNALGWDPLLDWPTKSDFTAAVKKQKRAVKAVLLDQSFSAGVGNWVADEVLYQCGVHPEQPAASLSQEKIDLLHHEIPSVCKAAADVDAESDRLPETWLFHHRWSKGKARKPKIGGHTIEHITVGGRTSAYVPALQKLDKSSLAAAASTYKTSKAKAGSGKANAVVETVEISVPIDAGTTATPKQVGKKRKAAVAAVVVVPKAAKKPAVPLPAKPATARKNTSASGGTKTFAAARQQGTPRSSLRNIIK